MEELFNSENLLNLINDENVNPVGSVFKLLLSMTLGAAIGLERRHKGQIAGMRTFALICMGATLAMLVSIYIPERLMGLTENGDPGRIAAQVISGIGFLGAGAIIQMKGSVRGLTTAAGMWMTASIGLAVGASMYGVAVIASMLIILVLTLLERCERHLFKGKEQKIVRLKVNYILQDAEPFRKLFRTHNVHISDEFFRYDYTQGTTIVNFMVRSQDKTDFIALFDKMHATGDVLSLTLTNEVNN
ncbi:MAG: MgtC/SapB family protein [Bacteroidaceae bacterium]|nr:MgtC/SapB family protein [Bacteroidaceae bacterium]